jgi:hypothetical protein
MERARDAARLRRSVPATTKGGIGIVFSAVAEFQSDAPTHFSLHVMHAGHAREKASPNPRIRNFLQTVSQL